MHVFHDALPDLSDDAALTLYRIIQEALTNAVRHGRAASVHIGLMGREGGVSLSVEDDGQGFDADAGTEGLGLTLMRERAARLGGTLRVESRLPLPAASWSAAMADAAVTPETGAPVLASVLPLTCRSSSTVRSSRLM